VKASDFRTRVNPVALNLSRLFRWHGLGNRDVAHLLGCQEHTVGAWIAGKREPGADYLLTIANLFCVDPRELHSDPREFGPLVADPDRMEALDRTAWRERGYITDEYGRAWKLKLKAV
jgi:hypothetical protein